MAFPRDKYEEFLREIMPAGATLYWKGDPEPFITPVNGPGEIAVKIDVGTSYGYGTSEWRRIWVPTAQNGDGAWATYVLQRMVWPLTIDIESIDSSQPGEDYLMELRGKIRWPTSVQKIQDMGITTIKVGNVISMIRQQEDHESFGSVLEIKHGQCFVSQAVDDDGNVIDTVTINGLLTGGAPDPIVIPPMGPLQIGN